MFALRARTRTAWIARLNEFHGGGVTDVFAGNAPFRWAQEVFIALGVVIAAMIGLLLATGTLFLPGWLLAIYIVNKARPPRALGVADDEVVVASRSFWSGKPNAIIATAPRSSVHHDRSTRRFTVDDEVVTLPPKEQALLLETVGEFASA